MKLVIPVLSKPIEFKENQINIIVIENPSLLYKMIVNFVNQIESDKGGLVLSENNIPISIHKYADIIIDYITLDLNERRILNKVYKIVENAAVNEDNYLKTLEIQSTILQYMEGILDCIDYPIIYDDVNILALLKSCNTRIVSEHDTLIEKIIDYIRIMIEICNIKLFVFVNLKQFLSFEDVQTLYKEVNYKKVNILLLEGICSSDIFECEKIIIIDKDMCEIY